MFEIDVRDSLISSYGYSPDEATEIIERYRPAFRLMIEKTTATQVAGRIHSDILSGTPVDNYVEYLSMMNQLTGLLAESMRFPEPPTTGKRPVDFCQNCGEMKYQGTACPSCGHSPLRR